MRRKTDTFINWVAGIGASLIVILLSWIGVNVTSIPVIKNDIATIKATNMEKIADHEARIRKLEIRH